MQVLEKLQEEYNDTFTTANLIIAATHTHAAPGSYLQYMTYSFSTKGFQQAIFDIISQGIIKVQIDNFFYSIA